MADLVTLIGAGFFVALSVVALLVRMDNERILRDDSL